MFTICFTITGSVGSAEFSGGVEVEWFLQSGIRFCLV